MASYERETHPPTKVHPISKALGKHGPAVTAIGFGCMGLSAFYGSPKPDSERFALLDAVYDSGCFFWDTADVYGDNEQLLGRWFNRRPGARENVVLATKCANTFDPETGKRTVCNDPEYIRQQCEKSLKALATDYIDIYYIHRIDTNQPIEITMATMKQLQEQGKIRHIGLSEVSPDTLRRACKIVNVVAVQQEYSPFSMDVEQIGLLEACRELGVAIVSYSPLSRGFLTGKIRSREDLEKGDFRLNMPRFSQENFHHNLELVSVLKSIADRRSCTTSQLVLAWLIRNDVFPIPGTTRLENFHENMGALDVSLSHEEDDEIRTAVGQATITGERYPEASRGHEFADTIPLEAASEPSR